MKDKPLRKKRNKPRPILDLLQHIEHILLILFERENNSNGIFRLLVQTGFSYKRDVLDAIEYLEKGKLIKKSHHPHHSTKIVSSLTDVGRNIASLILSIDKYSKSLADLENFVNEELEVKSLKEINELEKSTLRPKRYSMLPSVVRKLDHSLKNKGWSENERTVFLHDGYRVPYGIRYLLHESPSFVLTILLKKYQQLLQYDLNENARLITQGIIIELVTKVLKRVNVERLYSVAEVEFNSDDLGESVFEQIALIAGWSGLVYQSINQRVMAVMESMMSVAGPSKEYFETKIKAHMNGLKELLAEENYEGWNSAEIYRDKSRSRLIDFYQKISETRN